MALPSIPPATLPSAATLASSELYTQTLATEADVLKAAQAWPVLANSLADMTNPPARQQLTIAPGSRSAERANFIEKSKRADRKMRGAMPLLGIRHCR